jgi:biotin transport system substrate-specific component
MNKKNPAVLIKVTMMAAITSVLAFITIPNPLSPVPISGQTLGVMLAGSLLGPIHGALSMSLYLLIGGIGIPVFAGGNSGLSALFGVSGGFLCAFVPGAFITGLITVTFPRKLTDGFNSKYKTALLFAGNFTGGVLAIHAAGIVYTAKFTGISLGQAFLSSSLPLIPGDIFKTMIAVAITVKTLDYIQPYG